MFRRIISITAVITFIMSSVLGPNLSYAQALALPQPGDMVGLTAAYTPVMMKGLKVHADNPLLFDFIIDPGKSGLKSADPAFKAESEKLIKYFLASLTIKEDDLWVNLSPYEKDRMIVDELGQTVLGRDMLAQDYILKQLTASLVYPEKELGKKFWDSVYAQARSKFGTSDIPIDTFNKVWIVADKADVYEKNGTAYVTDGHLKVMLESDYLAAAKGVQDDSLTADQKEAQELGKQIVREVILPELEKEVNQGQNFAPLRQMFYSMILASWYKMSIKDALLNQVYSNQAKTNGVKNDDPTVKEKIYSQYLEAYKKGVFNYIKEDVNAATQESVPHKYFSGGLRIDAAQIIHHVATIPAGLLPVTLIDVQAGMANAALANVAQAPAVSLTEDGIKSLLNGTKFTDAGTARVRLVMSKGTGRAQVISAPTMRLGGLEPSSMLSRLKAFFQGKGLADLKTESSLKGNELTIRVSDAAMADRFTVRNERGFSEEVHRDPYSGRLVNDYGSEVRPQQRYGKILDGDGSTIDPRDSRLRGTEYEGDYAMATVYTDLAAMRKAGITERILGKTFEVATRDGNTITVQVSGVSGSQLTGLEVGSGNPVTINASEFVRAVLLADRAMTPNALAQDLSGVMQRLGLKDVTRFVTTMKTSTDAVLVTELAREARRSPEEVLAALDKNPLFRSVASLYRKQHPRTRLTNSDFQARAVDVTISSDMYDYQGQRASEGHENHELFQDMEFLAGQAGNVPFVFRDDMVQFVGRFLKIPGAPANTTGFPDLQDIVDMLKTQFFGDKRIDLQGIEYIITSGIGANEEYSHQLAMLLKRLGIKWIVVNNPDHMDRIPDEANNGNTVVFEMSRSGTTQETYDFFQRTKDRFKKRVVAAVQNKLRTAGEELASDPQAVVASVVNIPGYIGGRHMNRKTLMVAAPLFMALAVGYKDIAKAEEGLRQYFQGLYDANEELSYKNQEQSTAVKVAELILAQREVGRNQIQLLFSGSLKGSANETYQTMNEGGQKYGAGGQENNNLIYEFNVNDQGDMERHQIALEEAPENVLPVFLLDKSSADYESQKAYADGLKQKGIPAIVFTVDLRKGTAPEDVKHNLMAIARTSALMQDTIVYFTYLTRQDANSNPAVKLVRELTNVANAFIKEKRAASGQNADIRMTIADFSRAITESQAANLAVEKAKLKSVSAVEAQETLRPMQEGIADLARDLKISEEQVVSIFLASITKSVMKIDIGEAANTNTAKIEAVFGASDVDAMLGQKSPERVITPVTEQRRLLDTKDRRISAGFEAGEAPINANGLEDTLAQYLVRSYTAMSSRQGVDNLVLTYMERDQDNPTVSEIATRMTRSAARVGLRMPKFYLPGRAHSGIEGLMARAHKAINISIVYTEADKTDNGKKDIGGISVNDATYMYGISNVIRMFLGGSRGIVFEVRNDEDLKYVQGVINNVMDKFDQLVPKRADRAMTAADIKEKLKVIEPALSKIGFSVPVDEVIGYVENEIKSTDLQLNELSFVVTPKGLTVIGDRKEASPQLFMTILAPGQDGSFADSLAGMDQQNISVKHQDNYAVLAVDPSKMELQRAVLRSFMQETQVTGTQEIAPGLTFDNKALSLTAKMSRQAFVAEAEETVRAGFVPSAEQAKVDAPELWQFLQDIKAGKPVKLVITKALADKWKLQERIGARAISSAPKATAGIRAVQNILNNTDLTQPMNLLFALFLVNELGESAYKIAMAQGDNQVDGLIAGESRYFTQEVNDMLARRLAFLGITVHSPARGQKLPIGAISFAATKMRAGMMTFATPSHSARAIFAGKVTGPRRGALPGFARNVLGQLGLLDVVSFEKSRTEGAQLLIEEMVKLAEGINGKIAGITEDNPLVFEFAQPDDPKIQYDLDNVDSPANIPVAKLYADYLKSYAGPNEVRQVTQALQDGLKIGFHQANGAAFRFFRATFANLFPGVEDRIEWGNVQPDPFFDGTGMGWFKLGSVVPADVVGYVEQNQDKLNGFFASQELGYGVTANLQMGEKTKAVRFEVFDENFASQLNILGMRFIKIGNQRVLGYFEPKVTDYSADVSLLEVIVNSGIPSLLKDKPVGYIEKTTDPDGDRKVVVQVEANTDEVKSRLKRLNVSFVVISADKLLAVYAPNQNFFELQQFYVDALKSQGVFKQDRPDFDEKKDVNFFAITTTVSTNAWRDLYKKNKIPFVMCPVGFKEIARILILIEYQLMMNKARLAAGLEPRRIFVHDVFGQRIDLGFNPRLFFGGEESGGSIFGATELLKSFDGVREFLGWREKNAVEPSTIMLMMAAKLYEEGKAKLGIGTGDPYANPQFGEEMSLSKVLENYYGRNSSENTAELRTDLTLTPDALTMLGFSPAEKKRVEAEAVARRDSNDAYFCSLAFALQDGSLTLDQVKAALVDAFKGDKEAVARMAQVSGGLTEVQAMQKVEDVINEQIKGVYFQGDGVYFDFKSGGYGVGRPSGTDPKMKGYPSTNDPVVSALLGAAITNLNPIKYPPKLGRDMLTAANRQDLLSADDVLKRKQKQYEEGLKTDEGVAWSGLFDSFEQAGLNFNDLLILQGLPNQKEPVILDVQNRIAYVKSSFGKGISDLVNQNRLEDARDSFMTALASANGTMDAAMQLSLARAHLSTAENRVLRAKELAQDKAGDQQALRVSIERNLLAAKTALKNLTQPKAQSLSEMLEPATFVQNWDRIQTSFNYVRQTLADSAMDMSSGLLNRVVADINADPIGRRISVVMLTNIKARLDLLGVQQTDTNNLGRIEGLKIVVNDTYAAYGRAVRQVNARLEEQKITGKRYKILSEKDLGVIAQSVVLPETIDDFKINVFDAAMINDFQRTLSEALNSWTPNLTDEEAMGKLTDFLYDYYRRRTDQPVTKDELAKIVRSFHQQGTFRSDWEGTGVFYLSGYSSGFGHAVIQIAETKNGKVSSAISPGDIRNDTYSAIPKLLSAIDFSLEEMRAQPDAAEAPGGIELNANEMGLNVARDGNGIQMKFDPAMVAQFQKGDFTGIVPVILNITPIANPSAMLGMAATEETSERT